MAPGYDGLPAAQRDVDVAGPVGRFLAELPPSGLRRLKLGLRVFEWLPFPWRFSHLDLPAREDFLEKMEGSRRGPYHDLVLLAKVLSTLGYAVVPEVKKRVGYEVSCELADGSLPPSPPPLGNTTPQGAREDCDVVVVGSGAGGAAAAATLAEAGLD